MLASVYNVRMPERTRTVLPIISARMDMTCHGFILAAIDAAIRELADHDELTAGILKLAEERETVFA